MRYDINTYDEDILVDSVPGCTEQQVKKIAPLAASQRKGCLVFVEWYRKSDGQRGYLNPNGNHAITGVAWEGNITPSAAAAALGRSRSPRKTDASRANGAKGGRPAGKSIELTPLQREAYDLRQSGLKLREIAERMGRQPENVRQLVARAETKIRRDAGKGE